MKILRKITVEKTGNIFVFETDSETGKPVGKGFWCTENGDPMNMKNAEGVLSWAKKNWDRPPVVEDVADSVIAERLHLLFSDKPFSQTFGKSKGIDSPFAGLAGVRDSLQQAEASARMAKAKKRNA